MVVGRISTPQAKWSIDPSRSTMAQMPLKQPRPRASFPDTRSQKIFMDCCWPLESRHLRAAMSASGAQRPHSIISPQ